MCLLRVGTIRPSTGWHSLYAVCSVDVEIIEQPATHAGRALDAKTYVVTYALKVGARHREIRMRDEFEVV